MFSDVYWATPSVYSLTDFQLDLTKILANFEFVLFIMNQSLNYLVVEMKLELNHKKDLEQLRHQLQVDLQHLDEMCLL